MSTKKILSVAASTAILITGLSALELENLSGTAPDKSATPKGQYIGGQDTNLSEDNLSDEDKAVLGFEKERIIAGDLTLSEDLRGDALIYPYYRQGDGWETEITVRNTTLHATVAKAVIYRNDDSLEQLDFNIYLSPFDSATFIIRDNKIVTKDKSFAANVSRPSTGVNHDQVVMVGSNSGISAEQLDEDGSYKISGVEPGVRTSSGKRRDFSDKGYVVIYGMAQHNDGISIDSFTEDDLRYHQKHAQLFLDYRKILDECRPQWRDAFASNRSFDFGSIMVPNITAPNVSPSCVDGSTDPLIREFGDVKANTLTGTVRIYKADAEQSRDLIIPATALHNFTSNQMMLWTEGEWAAISDRRLVPGADGKSTVSRADVLKDAEAFYTKSAYYTFKQDSVANKLIVTQPMKRVLNSFLSLDEKEEGWSNYWGNYDRTEDRSGAECLSHPDTDKVGYYSYDQGGFTLNNWVVDNDEQTAIKGFSQVLEPITSPYTITVSKYSINCEVAELGDEYFQKSTEVIGANPAVANGDGFAYVKFGRGEGDHAGLPAIVSQMIGTKVGKIAQTNWIYAPTIK